MKYFLLIFVVAVVLVAGIAGSRGKLSRKPPIEIFSDMDRQPKIRPQTPERLFQRWKIIAPARPGNSRPWIALSRKS